MWGNGEVACRPRRLEHRDGYDVAASSRERRVGKPVDRAIGEEHDHRRGPGDHCLSQPPQPWGQFCAVPRELVRFGQYPAQFFTRGGAERAGPVRTRRRRAVEGLLRRLAVLSPHLLGDALPRDQSIARCANLLMELVDRVLPNSSPPPVRGGGASSWLVGDPQPRLGWLLGPALESRSWEGLLLAVGLLTVVLGATDPLAVIGCALAVSAIARTCAEPTLARVAAVRGSVVSGVGLGGGVTVGGDRIRSTVPVGAWHRRSSRLIRGTPD